MKFKLRFEAIIKEKAGCIIFFFKLMQLILPLKEILKKDRVDIMHGQL